MNTEVLILITLFLFSAGLVLWGWLSTGHKKHIRVPCEVIYQIPKDFIEYCKYVLEQNWSEDPDTLKLCLYLNSIVHVTDGMKHGILIRRGECLVDIKDLFDEIGMHECIARRSMYELMEKRAIELVKFTDENQVIVKLLDFYKEKGGKV